MLMITFSLIKNMINKQLSYKQNKLFNKLTKQVNKTNYNNLKEKFDDII